MARNSRWAPFKFISNFNFRFYFFGSTNAPYIVDRLPYSTFGLAGPSIL
jgi:hypothetical protein